MIKKSFLFNSIIIFCVGLPSQAWSYPYSEIYVFGDSLSDTGRFFEATGLPPAPYFEGRISNGKMWVEYLAEFLNLTYNPQTNFAWAGAMSGTTNSWSEKAPDAKLWGLQQQVDTYIKNTAAADPEGLYVVWAGSNDFMGDVTNPQETITVALDNIVTAVKNLHQHGAQHILVPNLGDLGKTPRSLPLGSISGMLSGLTDNFNQALAKFLQPFNVMQADMPASLEMLADPETMTDPVSLNLTNFTEACLDSEAERVCDTPDNYFFWDNIHPTTQGHLAIALIFNSAVTEPQYIDTALFMQVVEIVSDTGNELVLNAKLSLDPEDNRFALTAVRSVIQTKKTYQSLITFPNDREYPTFTQSTGVLHLPIVHLGVTATATAGITAKVNFISKYTADLSLVPETLGNPFKAPMFLLTGAEPLED